MVVTRRGSTIAGAGGIAFGVLTVVGTLGGAPGIERVPALAPVLGLPRARVPALERLKLDAMTRPSIYEFAGGDEAFLALAAATHERCLADPELNHPFSHRMNPRHLENLAAYWAEVFGGPKRYSESLGGHSGMLVIHAGEGAGPDFSERFLECFMQAADDAQLPNDAEFREALRSYMEWATEEVDSYSPPGTIVKPGQPMPHWSWDGLQST